MAPVYLTPKNSSLETPVNGDVIRASWTVWKTCAYELVRQHKLGAVRLGKYVRVAPEILAEYLATLAGSSQLDTMSNLMKRRK